MLFCFIKFFICCPKDLLQPPLVPAHSTENKTTMFIIIIFLCKWTCVALQPTAVSRKPVRHCACCHTHCCRMTKTELDVQSGICCFVHIRPTPVCCSATCDLCLCQMWWKCRLATSSPLSSPSLPWQKKVSFVPAHFFHLSPFDSLETHQDVVSALIDVNLLFAATTSHP